jgi:hypothetical protein
VRLKKGNALRRKRARQLFIFASQSRRRNNLRAIDTNGNLNGLRARESAGQIAIKAKSSHQSSMSAVIGRGPARIDGQIVGLRYELLEERMTAIDARIEHTDIRRIAVSRPCAALEIPRPFRLFRWAQRIEEVGIIAPAPKRLRRHQTDLLASNFSLRKDEYSLIFLVHFYHSAVLTQIVRAIKPGGFLVLETVDNRGGNYLELPHVGEIFRLISALRIINCIATPSGPKADRQVVKLIAERP